MNRKKLISFAGFFLLLVIALNVRKMPHSTDGAELKRAHHFVADTLQDLDEAIKEMKSASEEFVRNRLDPAIDDQNHSEDDLLTAELLKAQVNRVDDWVRRATSTLKYLDLLEESGANPPVSEMREQIRQRIEQLEEWRDHAQQLRQTTRKAAGAFTEI